MKRCYRHMIRRDDNGLIKSFTTSTRTIIIITFMTLLYTVTICSGLYNCDEGCDLSINNNNNNNDNIVCGNDHNTYANECIAICQNVKVIKTGSCIATNNDGAKIQLIQDSSSYIASETIIDFIPIQIMKQYETLGYKLVRKWDYTKLNGKVRIPSVVIDKDVSFDGNKTSVLQQQSYKPSMMTSDGYEYVGKEEIFDTNNIISKEGPRSVDGYDPVPSVVRRKLNSSDNRRTLKVIGTDDRVQIINTTLFPYKVIGALGYTPDNLVCTGTVISKTAVLTAAHCVWDVIKQVWIPHSYFAPGRGYNGIAMNDPYGRWFVDKVYILNAYKSSSQADNWGLDIAVITYKPNTNGQNIGDVVGYTGIEEVDGYDDPDLDLSTFTGYPVNKGGRTMWTMGVCPSGFVNPIRFGSNNDNNVALHDCDITQGTSGSSIMRLSGIADSSTYRVRGVNAFEVPNVPWNGANVFMRGNGLYDAVLFWSGRYNSTGTSFDPVSCFSKSNTVEVMNIGNIPINQLHIGDYVKTKNYKYTRVYSFGHLSHEIESTFLQLSFDDKQHDPLEVSSRHFVYVDSSQQSNDTKWYQYRQQQTIKPAYELIVGDVLSGKKITSIQEVNRFGVYAPLTESGDMMVNDILVSNYVHLIDSSWMLGNQHAIGHIIFSPYRYFCGYYIDSCKEETYTEDGYSIYASRIGHISDTINRFGGGYFISLIVSFLFVPNFPSIGRYKG